MRAEYAIDDVGRSVHEKWTSGCPCLRVHVVEGEQALSLFSDLARQLPGSYTRPLLRITRALLARHIGHFHGVPVTKITQVEMRSGRVDAPASSRVGEITSTETALALAGPRRSTVSMDGSRKATVFPEPVLARARMSRPFMQGLMDSARHVIGCHLTPGPRGQIVFDDVAALATS